MLNPCHKKRFIKANKLSPQRLVISQVAPCNYTNVYNTLYGDNNMVYTDTAAQTDTISGNKAQPIL
ncbi:MAG: hypothetical protein EAZ51_04650 [Sphingobacteriales bacterium]|nr:MAG: hypothetical protein EAZ64_03180 [Sphingobacteriales bacterium]TAF81252.1 MAG: hypothetical protein EAZ51_04650 [Sphingobacteriales bacterium]